MIRMASDRRFKAVLLDVDGTLIESNDAHARAFEHAFRESGHTFPFEDVRRLIGMGGDNLLPTLANIPSDSSEGKHISHRKKDFFNQEFDSIKPQPGAKALIEMLKRQHFKVAVASSCSSAELDKFLGIIGVDKGILDSYTTSDDIDSSKPDPDVVHESIKRLQVDPSEAIMVGDTPFDVEAAAKAGVASIVFRCGGFWSDKDFPRALAIYDNPQDLIDNMLDSPLAMKGASQQA
jgi:HAD superfamily hydrolase (TIGR01549 family)